MYKDFLKNILDFLIALSAFIILSPIFVIVLILLSIQNSGKPFFFQVRPGKNEVLFKIIKFKTMNDKMDRSGTLLPDAKRLTKVGAFVRKTSLDELPQLINVIKGDMSLIGPRPLLPEYLPLYTEEQRRRHSVKPGITGLAQVKGRNEMMFSERLKNDIEYVNNISFILDCQIVIQTLYTIIFKSQKIIHGQTVDEVDDLGLSKNLSANHFKNKDNEHQG
jgi:undecaprenyl phosphate N,N'-diacetylbacillosamine 1-phosphate transferase